jgi:hypothetical protein
VKKIGCRQLQTRDLRSRGLHRVETNWHVWTNPRTNVWDKVMSRTNDTAHNQATSSFVRQSHWLSTIPGVLEGVAGAKVISNSWSRGDM